MPEFQTVQVSGQSFRCRVDGPATDAPWVLFSNSLGTDLTVWDAQVAALADRFRVLRYDQRGHGGTAVPNGPCDFDRLGDDALALLDHFGIERCSFVGLSMGVPTGLRLVDRAPGRAERLVLCDGQAATASGGAGVWEERIRQIRDGGMAAFADATVARWFAPEFVQSGRAEAVRAMVAATPAEGLIACATALQGFDFAYVLPAIRVPTLLIVGARDGALPATMAAMRGKIPGAPLVEIPDAGHIPNVEQPDAFNRALLTLLND